MAKQIKQFRYYSDKNENNQPPSLTANELANGTAFKDIVAITQLGIQTLPGIRFYLNNSRASDSGNNECVIIGSTGIYELDLDGISEITQLNFASEQLENNIANNPNAYLIIDMICEED